ncbi:exonuclease SbcCD subunit D [Clostridium paraputrificum]|uniref:exonuclease SbcCD subunit D n=1 Tax=Clostridium paraputrificum TaxID=29363 RepID=UPI0006695A01|nr:exonuclease SbcCD subunit D [Clostridium paraputrificum]MDB2108125.1 exonuclease SbcCD subunit D [Clostridium paraputrificum]MDB2114984.1 exonuclease SbcCD subunit D [Clostridium paraputrificum]
MKIIHTGDWHIGKIVNEFSMIDDQRYILNELIKLINLEKPDVLIIAGDIYDRSIPPVEAVDLLNEVFSRILIDNKVKIVAISGNHDSGERVSFGSKILEKEGLYIQGIIEDEIKSIRIDDEEGNVNFYMIPYVDPAILRRKFNNPEIRNHNDAMKAVINRIKPSLNENERNIVVTHGYVTYKRKDAIDKDGENLYELADLEVSDSERPLSIGGTDLIDSDNFDCFDYVALGHLHGRQKVGREEIRYSGSLMKYSFSEINHKKGVVIIEIDGNKKINIRQEELRPKRNMRIIKGPLDELIKAGLEDCSNREDYIQAILTDEGEIIDPIGKLRSAYPNIMILKREEKKDIGTSLTAASKGYKSKTELELFEEYYDRLGSGEFTEEKKEVIRNVVNEVFREGGK